MTVYRKYPLIRKLIELMYEFKRILLNNKSEHSLFIWFKKANKINLSYIHSFIIGCNNYMLVILNAIKYEYSDGVVEASVNKIKLIKRIMDGRCSFELLKSKIFFVEKISYFQLTLESVHLYWNLPPNSIGSKISGKVLNVNKSL